MIADVVWLLHQDSIVSDALPLGDIPLPDPADVAIVSSALNADADVLVTGDKEIIDLRKVGRLKILTPRQFWEMERTRR